MYSDSDFGRSGGDPGPPLPALLKWELAPVLGGFGTPRLGWILGGVFAPVFCWRSRFSWYWRIDDQPADVSCDD
jgi:hypothetical protein